MLWASFSGHERIPKLFVVMVVKLIILNASELCNLNELRI